MVLLSLLGRLGLLAALTVAAPTEQAELARKARMSATLKTLREKHNFSTMQNSTSTLNKRVYDNENWGGAVTKGNQIIEAYGTLNVPTVTFPSSPTPSDKTYYGCAWVGIGGDGCEALFQAGVYWEGTPSNGWQYTTFYEWYPESNTEAGLSVSTGDEVVVSLVSSESDLSSGTVTLTNTNTGQKWSKDLTGQSPNLCTTNAAWIVEENVEANLMPDFGTITFTDASYVDGSTTNGISDAQIFAVDNNGVVWTDCNIESSSSVQCKWQEN